MLLALFFASSSVAFAFSSAPTKVCSYDQECVLVRESHCSSIVSIRMGQEKKWVEWQKIERARAQARGDECPGKAHEIRPELLEPRCENSRCTVVPRAGTP